MQTPTPERSSDMLVRLGVYSTARLAASPQTSDLVPLLRARTDDLRQARRGREEAHDQLMDTEAVADAADAAMDLAIKVMADDAYNTGGRSYSSLQYRRIFPNGQAPYTQPRLFDQVETTGSLLGHMDNLADDPVVARHRPEIEARHSALTAALVPYGDAVKGLGAARSSEYLAKVAFCATYVSTYGAVVQALGAKPLAEPFFRRFRARSAPVYAPEAPDVDDVTAEEPEETTTP